MEIGGIRAIWTLRCSDADSGPLTYKVHFRLIVPSQKYPPRACCTQLPCGKSEFQLGSPRSSITLKDTETTQSIYAELVRAMSLWSSVVFFIKQTGLNLASRLIEIRTLDSRIREAWSKLDSSFNWIAQRWLQYPCKICRSYSCCR